MVAALSILWTLLGTTLGLALSSAWADPPPATAGPGDIGGGGSVIRCDDQSPWVLLDRANRNPSLLKTPAAENTPTTPSPELIRIQRVPIAETPAYARAREILKRWAHNSPDLVEMIEEAMIMAPYLRTSSRIQAVPEYTLNPEISRLCPGAKPVTAIHFLPRYGSILSDPLWSAADLDTQAGLLIHEALRQIQLGYYFRSLNPQANPREQFTNADVEAITAQIIDGDPNVAPGPQNSPHIRGRLRRHLDGKRTHRQLNEKTGRFLDAPPNSSVDPCIPADVTIDDIKNVAIFRLILMRAAELETAISAHQYLRDPEQAWRELRRGGLIAEPAAP